LKILRVLFTASIPQRRWQRRRNDPQRLGEHCSSTSRCSFQKRAVENKKYTQKYF
jgi:hypothetical protein